jgi:hypothetical protein
MAIFKQSYFWIEWTDAGGTKKWLFMNMFGEKLQIL